MAVITYKCPNCGGELQFDPETQKYKCPYCLSVLSQEEADAAAGNGSFSGDGEKSDQAFQNAQTEHADSFEYREDAAQEGREEAVLFTCPSCGAELVTDDTTAATFCYYCHNPVVLSGRLSGDYLPDKIIPFQLTKEKAREDFLSFVRKRKFTPSAFFSGNQIEKLSGVYYPYWVCRASGHGSLRAEGTKVRVWITGKVEYTETKVYEVEREGDFSMEELPKSALSKADHQLSQGVWPYDLAGCQPFRMSYLSGFLAEKRDLERTDFQAEFDREIQEFGKNAMRESVEGYSTVAVHDSRVEDVKQDWDYVLLPVWALTYKGKNGKTYYYAMNGQNGKFAGALPVDAGKLAALFFAVALPVLVLCLIGGYLL